VTILTKRLAGFLAGVFLLLSTVSGQHPTTTNPAADQSWPSVGFQLVLDTPSFLTGKTVTIPPDNSSGRGDIIIYITNAGDGSNRLYLVERRGRIWIMENGKLLPDPFLDISGLTTYEPNSERGMLSLAFPPGYKDKHHFYVFYTASSKDPGATLGDLTLARYRVDPQDPVHALKDSGEIIMRIPHPQYNGQNGGQILFGKDGMLYWGTGDGGGGSDPTNNAQNLDSLLGKMLRLDMEGGRDPEKNYHVPSSNPFVGNPAVQPEIWALGLRNPYRFCFDPVNGDLYIANVGHERYEQIYYAPAGGKGGENYGWNIYEGTHEFEAPMPGPRSLNPIVPTVTFPIVDLSHPLFGPDKFVCIIGGYVYRGAEHPDWQGIYFFTDWQSGQIWGLRRNAVGNWEMHVMDTGKSPLKGLVSFGEDEKGGLYVSSYGDAKVYKLIDAPRNP